MEKIRLIEMKYKSYTFKVLTLITLETLKVPK